MPATWTAQPATPNQISFISRLVTERNLPSPQGTLTKGQASTLIDTLLKVPVAKAAPKIEVVQEDAVTECGMYRDGLGQICKVQKSRDSENLYAKRLVKIGGERLSETNEVVKWEFVYEAGLIYRLQASQRMTLEEAKQFGIQFGVCCVCGAFLKDAKSVAAGIGPVCAGKV